MRILHVIARADPAEGGPIEGVQATGRILHGHGHIQELLTLDDPTAPYLAAFPSRLHALGTSWPQGRGAWARFRRWSSYRPQAVRWLRANVSNYDAVIVNGLWNYSTHVARRVLPGGNVPYLVYTHGMLDPWFATKYPVKNAIKQILWRINEGVLVNRASHVVFTCEEERRLARQGFRPWRARELVTTYGTADAPAETAAQHSAFRDSVPALGDRRPALFAVSQPHPREKGLRPVDCSVCPGRRRNARRRSCHRRTRSY